ncbi:hypothetical protein H131_16023 [Lysinibacillus sphaericus OT4b.31]|uniref:Abortive phage infection protein C-terminal domain-containing protein n=2 Tax=Lysinibacillus sphaericus TaxID=1421 RepID=R7ZBH0_LYSSH|nr:hypothetical protein H131_16023 [Lysinibacillus sphaericus OT4b.31]
MPKNKIKFIYKVLVVPNQFTKHSINIKSRIKATEVSGLDTPKTNGRVFTVKLYDLVELYNKVGDELFKYNLRIGIDDQLNVNTEIFKTLSYNPEEFWFLNNGISMILSQECLEMRQYNSIELTNLYKNNNLNISIINGAQTITASSKFFYNNFLKSDYDRLIKLIDRDTTVWEKIIKSINKSINNNCSIDETTINLAIYEASKIIEITSNENLKEWYNSLKRDSDILKQIVKTIIEFLNPKFLEDTRNSNKINESTEFLFNTIKSGSIALNKAAENAHVILRVIYYQEDESNKTSITNLTSKITVALNRQKPIKSQDISLVSCFVQNVNALSSGIINQEHLNSDVIFEIIRRGEIESTANYKYDLANLVRILVSILGQNPGAIKSTKIEDLLSIKEKSEPSINNSTISEIISFKNNTIFKDFINNYSYESEEFDSNTFIFEFQKYYSFVNTAMFLDLKLKEQFKILSKESKDNTIKKFISQLNLNELLKNKAIINNDDFTDKFYALVNYGNYYLFSCWFYELCFKSTFTLNDSKIVKEMNLENPDFGIIDYNSPIFKDVGINKNNIVMFIIEFIEFWDYYMGAHLKVNNPKEWYLAKSFKKNDDKIIQLYFNFKEFLSNSSAKLGPTS